MSLAERAEPDAAGGDLHAEMVAMGAAARAADCDAVYSEDMSAGQDYDGVRVINPFTPSPGN